MTPYEELQAWLNGTATGGPSSDGRYPLTAADATVHLVLCPAAQATAPSEDPAAIEVFANTASAGAASANASAVEATAAKVAAASSAANALASANTSTSKAALALTSSNTATTKAAEAAASAAAALLDAAEAHSWALTAQSTVIGLLRYKGAFNASSGSFPASPTAGDFWKVSGAGVISGVDLNAGDQIIYSGTGWDKIDNTEQVTSVAGRVGAVTLSVPDVSGLQSALDGKAPAASPTFTGTVTLPSAAGTMTVVAGTGDNATYTTYNSRIHLHWGLAFSDFADNVMGVYDARAGRWDTKGGYRVNGQDVWHAGNFNPATKSDTSHNHDGRYVLQAPASTYSDANAVRIGVYAGTLVTPTTNTSSGSWESIINVGDGNWGFQLSHPWFGEDVYTRSTQNGVAGPWRKLWHDGNMPVSTSVVGWNVVQRDGNGYINANYINTTADVTPQVPTHIAMQRGNDNYIRWQTLAQFSTNLRATSSRGANPATDWPVGTMLRWKNYGAGHVIFDASQGTTPDGGACNNATPDVAWGGSYPTLMGWNGGQTYGVRVYIANVADSTSGAGTVTGTSLAVTNSGGHYFSGNGSGIQSNGTFFQNGELSRLAANGSVWIRAPRIYVQSADPGAAAGDGDLWMW